MPLSQRRAFTGLMSILATAFVIGIWRQRYSWQADFLADLSKIGVLVAGSTAVVGFTMWTLVQRGAGSRRRGALAGAITALLIIPLPAMAWAFKTEFSDLYQSGTPGLFGAAIQASSFAVKAGMLTFIGMTKASLIAILGSSVVGMCVAQFIAVDLHARDTV